MSHYLLVTFPVHNPSSGNVQTKLVQKKTILMHFLATQKRSRKPLTKLFPNTRKKKCRPKRRKKFGLVFLPSFDDFLTQKMAPRGEELKIDVA